MRQDEAIGQAGILDGAGGVQGGIATAEGADLATDLGVRLVLRALGDHVDHAAGVLLALEE